MNRQEKQHIQEMLIELTARYPYIYRDVIEDADKETLKQVEEFKQRLKEEETP